MKPASSVQTVSSCLPLHFMHLYIETTSTLLRYSHLSSSLLHFLPSPSSTEIKPPHPISRHSHLSLMASDDPDRPSITKVVKPLHEQDQAQDEEESSFASSCCIPRLFCFPCGRRNNSNNTEYRSLLQGEYRESWWMNRFQRTKEFTEVLAGPKWKTFIRRFSYSNNTHNNGKKRKQQSQYDPLSYALNFDAGADHEDCGGRVDFTVRFASSGKYGSEFVLVDNSKVAL